MIPDFLVLTHQRWNSVDVQIELLDDGGEAWLLFDILLCRYVLERYSGGFWCDTETLLILGSTVLWKEGCCDVECACGCLWSRLTSDVRGTSDMDIKMLEGILC
jgi:hypothetical protein